jgi:hypothetical protein
MKYMLWLIAFAAVAGIVYGLWRARQRWEERSRASEARFASFISQALPAGAPATGAAPSPVNDQVVQQRLLLEAAAKAGEAGEPALSIQLYAKLLSRYPQTSFAGQARAAVEAQKKKLAKPA